MGTLEWDAKKLTGEDLNRMDSTHPEHWSKRTAPKDQFELSVTWSGLSAQELGDIMKALVDLNPVFSDVMINSNNEGEN